MMFEDQYLHKLYDCVVKGVPRTVRQGVEAFSIGAQQLKADLIERFPLITTKKVNYDFVLSELFWFLRGTDDLKYLLDEGNPIWLGDAYRAYASRREDPMSKEAFKTLVKNGKAPEGVGRFLGKIYGPMWRGKHPADDIPDQLYRLIRGLREDPYSRRLLSVSWDPDVHLWPSDTNRAVLPPCHYSFQVTTHPAKDSRKRKYRKRFDVSSAPDNRLDLTFSMRSTDIALGLPFNMASYGTLLRLIANDVDMVPGILTMQTGDLHLYKSHTGKAVTQTERTPKPRAPRIKIEADKLLKHHGGSLKCSKEDVELVRYSSHPKINYPLEV